MSTVKAQLDRFVAGLLFVKTPAQTVSTDATTADSREQEGRKTEQIFGLSLFFSGARCVLQYVVLPFVLPLIGVAGNFAIQLTLVITVIAVIAIITSLRRFWRIDYAYKWQYLMLATVGLAILFAYIYEDVRLLFFG
jgi:hypothetical protein